MSEFAIGRRQLYILPTRIGWYFALILIALFAIAVKFDNQAAFMMLFILASMGMVAMLYTHHNVIDLELGSKPSNAVFQGEIATFPLRVINPSNKPRHAVWVVVDGFHQLLDIEAAEQYDVEATLPTISRGYLNCSNVILTSQFPLGLFFCWTKRYAPSQRCIVYPQPLDLVPFPQSSSNSSEHASNAKVSSNAEDYSGMKPYQAGDRLRDVHWPSLAKTQKLVTIQHEDQNNASVNLSWFDLPANMDIEDKLSQLCAWVIKSEKENLRYQLEMPNNTQAYNNGLNHYHQCLAVLALWGHVDN